MIYIGIDPGSSGGIAVHKDGVTSAIAMPKTDTDIVEYLLNIKNMSVTTSSEVSVMMEKVGGFIGMRKKVVNIMCNKCKNLIPYEAKEGDPGSRMFKFGDGNGFLRATCLTLGFRYETIAPRSWQSVYNLSKSKGMGKTQWKNILKDKAIKLFPQLKVTLSTADALIILDFLMRIQNKHNG